MMKKLKYRIEKFIFLDDSKEEQDNFTKTISITTIIMAIALIALQTFLWVRWFLG